MQNYLNIDEKDMKFINNFLSEKEIPVSLDVLINELAFFKIDLTKSGKVKIYNPNCEYKVGDYIYKEYSGSLPIGSKKYLEMNRGFVLRVEEVRNSKDLSQIKLSYEGTADFLKYIKYLERQKIELLLPHRTTRPFMKPEILPDEKDPRRNQAPMVSKELNKLKKKLIPFLQRSKEIAFNDERVLLKSNVKKIESDVFQKIKDFLIEGGTAGSTEFFVENFIKVDPSKDDFNLWCFSLNFWIGKDYILDFQKVNSKSWGRWHLISCLYKAKKEALVNFDNCLAKQFNKINKDELKDIRAYEKELYDDESGRYLISQREISSGALRVREHAFNFKGVAEISAIEQTSKKEFVLYYYEDSRFFLGFDEIYKKYKVSQGATIYIEQNGDDSVVFSFKTTKKGSISYAVSYDSQRDLFLATEEQEASPIIIDKGFALGNIDFEQISEKIDEYRAIKDVLELSHMIFMDFGDKAKNYELNILKFYHIMDCIYPFDFVNIIKLIRGHQEFISSDNVKGIFYLDSDSIGAIEEEEQDRRKKLEIEAKKKRANAKKEKAEEQKRKEEEIKRIREERRKKREEEMRIKEQRKSASTFNRGLGAEKGSSKNKEAVKSVKKQVKRNFVTIVDSEIDLEKEIMAATYNYNEKKQREEHYEKKEPEDRMEKSSKSSSKRVQEKIKEDVGIDMQEIKSQIELEELKEKALEKKVVGKKEKTAKKVAYKDEKEGFGGIFASKLEDAVKKK